MPNDSKKVEPLSCASLDNHFSVIYSQLCHSIGQVYNKRITRHAVVTVAPPFLLRGTLLIRINVVEISTMRCGRLPGFPTGWQERRHRPAAARLGVPVFSSWPQAPNAEIWNGRISNLSRTLRGGEAGPPRACAPGPTRKGSGQSSAPLRFIPYSLGEVRVTHCPPARPQSISYPAEDNRCPSALGSADSVPLIVCSASQYSLQ